MNAIGATQVDPVPTTPPTRRKPTYWVRPRPGWIGLSLRDLWDYNELLLLLVARDIKVRYKQTVLGAAWAVLQPLLTMVAFSVFFGRLAKVPSEGAAYPLFAFCALLPWQLFANSLSQSGNSLLDNAHLITKVYFPRLLVPLATVATAAVDFSIAFVVLLGMMLWYGVTPGWHILAVPAFVLFAMTTALAVGLWLSALNVKYRDVRYTIGFLVQFWLLVTPVAYPSSLVPERWHVWYGLNPMAGVVEGFRWALLGTGSPPGPMFYVSLATTAVLLVSGLYYFRRVEKTFADVV